MSEFSQDEALFILELGWAKIFEQAGLEDEGVYIDTSMSVVFRSPTFANAARELCAYNMPVSRIIESQSIKDIQELENFNVEIQYES